MQMEGQADMETSGMVVNSRDTTLLLGVDRATRDRGLEFTRSF